MNLRTNNCSVLYLADAASPNMRHIEMVNYENLDHVSTVTGTESERPGLVDGQTCTVGAITA